MFNWDQLKIVLNKLNLLIKQENTARYEGKLLDTAESFGRVQSFWALWEVGYLVSL